MKTITITVWDDDFGAHEWILEAADKEELKKALEACKDADNKTVSDLLELLK